MTESWSVSGCTIFLLGRLTSLSVGSKSHSGRFFRHKVDQISQITETSSKQQAETQIQKPKALQLHTVQVRGQQTQMLRVNREAGFVMSLGTGRNQTKEKTQRSEGQRWQPITVNHLLSYCGSGEEKLQDGRQSNAGATGQQQSRVM